MGFSQEMRKKRLDFYEEDVAAIDQIMSDFLDASGSKAVFMVDKEGHLVTKKGFTKALDGDSLAALVAGAFASTKEVAKLLGEQEFSVLFHQGKNQNIHVSLVHDRALMLTVFDERTTMGMVRLYAEELTTKIGDVLTKMLERSEKEGPRGLSQDGQNFEDSAEEKLSDFFREDKG